MDTEKVRRKVEAAYREAMSSDKRIASIAKKGKKSYTDAAAYASRAGRHMGEALANSIKEALDVAITEEEAISLIPPSLQLNYRNVSAIAKAAQEAMNEDVEIGLMALTPEFDERRAAEIAAETAENFIQHQLIVSCENASRKVVDESMRVNAEAQSRAGLEVTVTRIYDGVGLRDGTQVCEWCLERCGTDMPFQEAFDKGAFERHEGCGCDIFYRTSKRLQHQTDWHHNKWEDVSEKQLKARREHGV